MWARLRDQMWLPGMGLCGLLPLRHKGEESSFLPVWTDLAAVRSLPGSDDAGSLCLTLAP